MKFLALIAIQVVPEIFLWPRWTICAFSYLVYVVSFCPQIYHEHETDQILEAKDLIRKNDILGKWGLRKAFYRNF